MAILISEIEEILEKNSFVKFKGKSAAQPFIVSPDKPFRFLRFQLQTVQSINLDKIEIVDSDGATLLKEAKIIVSSSFNDEARFDGSRLIDGAPNGGVSFHSKNEKNPWLVIDLGSVKKCASITISNRNGKYFYRALSFVLSCSDNLVDWHIIHDNYAFTQDSSYLALPELEQALITCCTFNDTDFRREIYKHAQAEGNESACKYISMADHFLNKESLSYGPHGITETFAVKSEKQVDLAYQELSVLLTFLNKEMGIQSFVSSGTLLGMVRDGEFLGHDDDLDVCYISNFTEVAEILDERQQIKVRLTQKGYKVRNSDVAHFWVTTPNAITLDLFTGFVNSEGQCLMNPLPLPGVEVEHVTPVQIKSVKGFDIYLPHNPKPLLELNYGPNWRKPDPLWRFNWNHAKKLYGFLYFKN